LEASAEAELEVPVAALLLEQDPQKMTEKQMIDTSFIFCMCWLF
jgi:hypothetical protein